MLAQFSLPIDHRTPLTNEALSHMIFPLLLKKRAKKRIPLKYYYLTTPNLFQISGVKNVVTILFKST